MEGITIYHDYKILMLKAAMHFYCKSKEFEADEYAIDSMQEICGVFFLAVFLHFVILKV